MPKADGEIVGSQSNIPAVRKIVREIREELVKIAGNRDRGEEKFRFNLCIRTTRNVQELFNSKMNRKAGDERHFSVPSLGTKRF